MNDELNCSEVESLVTAYVLHALTDDEQCAFAAHLVECRLHDADLTTERRMATALGSSVSPVPAPQRLRSSLLDAFDKEIAGTPVPTPIAEAKQSRWPSFLRAPSFAYGLAAAVLVLALGLGVWGATRGGDTSVSDVRQATVRSNNMRLDVTYLGSHHLAVLSYDLPPAPAGKAYQAWKIADGKPQSLGLISSSGPMTVNADLGKAVAVAISVEPSGGSTQPTTTPLLVSQF